MCANKTPLVNIDDVPLVVRKHGKAFETAMGSITAPLGAKKLACRLFVVPAGMCAVPFHNHHANDEIFVIMNGNGTLRHGADRHPVRTGDVIVCPAGGQETAHQIINTSPDELRYLAFSSTHDPDISEYVDSGKFAVYTGRPPGDTGPPRFAFVGRVDSAVDYWDGEKSSPLAES